MAEPVKSNQQHIFIHDAICEGPIEGLVYGDSSIFFNGQRVQDLDPDAPWTPVNAKIDFSNSSDTIGSNIIPALPISFTENNGTPKNDTFLLIRNEGILKSSATYSYQNRELTITGASNFSEVYRTFNPTATAATQTRVTAGSLASPTITNGGSGYTTAPSVKVTRLGIVVPNVTVPVPVVVPPKEPTFVCEPTDAVVPFLSVCAVIEEPPRSIEIS